MPDGIARRPSFQDHLKAAGVIVEPPLSPDGHAPSVVALSPLPANPFERREALAGLQAKRFYASVGITGSALGQVNLFTTARGQSMPWLGSFPAQNTYQTEVQTNLDCPALLWCEFCVLAIRCEVVSGLEHDAREIMTTTAYRLRVRGRFVCDGILSDLPRDLSLVPIFIDGRDDIRFELIRYSGHPVSDSTPTVLKIVLEGVARPQVQ